MAYTCGYQSIRRRVIARCNNCPEQDLRRLKAQFVNHINSKRTLDSITTVEGLIRILEKRNVLNRDNLNCLRVIVQALDQNDLLQMMIPTNGVIRQPSNIPPPRVGPGPVLAQHRTTIHERVHQMICDEIGMKWKDLARALSISEGNIDELEERYRYQPSERVREILRHHERNYTEETFTWFPLLNALSKSRRTDLNQRVQRIIDER